MLDSTIEEAFDFFVSRLSSIADITEIEYKAIVEKYLDSINRYSGYTDDRVIDLRSYITPNHHVSLFEIIPCLSKLQLVDFQRYFHDFFKNVHVEALIQGNIEKEHLINTVERWLNGVNWGKIDDVSHQDS